MKRRNFLKLGLIPFLPNIPILEQKEDYVPALALPSEFVICKKPISFKYVEPVIGESGYVSFPGEVCIYCKKDNFIFEWQSFYKKKDDVSNLKYIVYQNLDSYVNILSSYFDNPSIINGKNNIFINGLSFKLISIEYRG